jgi:hypothetical protein
MKNTPAIVNFGAFDVVDVRKDGGLDLVVACQRPLDSSEETVRDLQTKINNYLIEIRESKNPTLLEKYQRAPDAKIRIVISCSLPLSTEVQDVVQDLRLAAHAISVEPILKQRPTGRS